MIFTEPQTKTCGEVIYNKDRCKNDALGLTDRGHYSFALRL